MVMLVFLNNESLSTYVNKSGGVSKKLIQPDGLLKMSSKKVERHNNSVVSKSADYITCLRLTSKDKIMCFDVDNKEDTLKTFNDFVEKKSLQHIYNTYHEYTPNGGMHFIFKYNDKNITNKSGLHIDIIKEGLSIMAPTKYTCNVTGIDKEYKSTMKYDSNSLLDIPEDLVNLLDGYYKENNCTIDDDIFNKLTPSELVFWKHLDSISRKAHQDFSSWARFGIICYNYFDGNEKGLNLWWQWSKDCSNLKYSDDDDNFDECRRHYITKFKKMYSASLTYKTLLKYSKYKVEIVDIVNDELTIEWDDFVKKYSNKFIDECINELLIDAASTFCYIENEGIIITLKPDGYDIDFLKDKVSKSAFTVYAYEESSSGNMIKKGIKIDGLISRYITKINTKKSIVFRPNTKTSTDFNLWRGYKAKYVDDYDVKKIENILNHLKEVWCSNDNELYHYVLSWLKQVIINPEKKTCVALLLIDLSYGAGKGAITTFLLDYVIGRVHGIAPSIRDILSEYNLFMKEKTLLCVDEIPSTKDDHFFQSEELKKYITDPVLRLGEKFKPKISIDSYHNYIMCSNNLNCLPIRDGDRRYCVLRPDPKYKNDEDHFVKIFDCHNDECGDIFYSFLHDYETDVNLRKIPNTDIKQEITSLNEDTPTTFFNELRNENYKIDDGDYYDDDGNYKKPDKIKSDELFKLYSKWCNDNGERKFGKRLFHSKLSMFKKKTGGEWFFIL